MDIPDHRRICRPHARPAFHWSMVPIRDRLHHFADIERFLPPRVRFVREDLTHEGEAFLAALAVGIELDVAIDGIGRRGPPGESLAGRDIGMLIMAEEDMAGFINVSSPVLRLAVE